MLYILLSVFAPQVSFPCINSSLFPVRSAAPRLVPTPVENLCCYTRPSAYMYST